MRKIRLIITGLLVAGILTGCKSSNKLNLEKITVNTLNINKDGSLQEGIVESFEADYYKETELKEYVEAAIDEFNKAAENEAISLEDLQVNDKTASTLIRYATIADFQKLNQNDAVLADLETSAGMIPEKLLGTDGQEVLVSDIREEKKADSYHVLMLSEEYDVIVNGSILYYSNGNLVDKKTVHTMGDGQSVIIYK